MASSVLQYESAQKTRTELTVAVSYVILAVTVVRVWYTVPLLVTQCNYASSSWLVRAAQGMSCWLAMPAHLTVAACSCLSSSCCSRCWAASAACWSHHALHCCICATSRSPFCTAQAVGTTSCSQQACHQQQDQQAKQQTMMQVAALHMMQVLAQSRLPDLMRTQFCAVKARPHSVNSVLTIPARTFQKSDICRCMMP